MDQDETADEEIRNFVYDQQQYITASCELYSSYHGSFTIPHTIMSLCLVIHQQMDEQQEYLISCFKYQLGWCVSRSEERETLCNSPAHFKSVRKQCFEFTHLGLDPQRGGFTTRDWCQVCLCVPSTFFPRSGSHTEGGKEGRRQRGKEKVQRIRYLQKKEDNGDSSVLFFLCLLFPCSPVFFFFFFLCIHPAPPSSVSLSCDFLSRLCSFSWLFSSCFW